MSEVGRLVKITHFVMKDGPTTAIVLGGFLTPRWLRMEWSCEIAPNAAKTWAPCLRWKHGAGQGTFELEADAICGSTTVLVSERAEVSVFLPEPSSPGDEGGKPSSLYVTAWEVTSHTIAVATRTHYRSVAAGAVSTSAKRTTGATSVEVGSLSVGAGRILVLVEATDPAMADVTARSVVLPGQKITLGGRTRYVAVRNDSAGVDAISIIFHLDAA